MKVAKPILVLLLVFFAGLAVGVFGTRYFVRVKLQQASREGGFFRDRMEREVISHLDLTAEQQEQVKAVFARSWEEFRDLRTEFHPRFAKIAEQTEAEIRSVLTPTQRTEFERMIAERKAMWGRPPGGRPGDRMHDGRERMAPPGFPQYRDRTNGFQRPDRPISREPSAN